MGYLRRGKWIRDEKFVSGECVFEKTKIFNLWKEMQRVLFFTFPDTKKWKTSTLVLVLSMSTCPYWSTRCRLLNPANTRLLGSLRQMEIHLYREREEPSNNMDRTASNRGPFGNYRRDETMEQTTRRDSDQDTQGR